MHCDCVESGTFGSLSRVSFIALQGCFGGVYAQILWQQSYIATLNCAAIVIVTSLFVHVESSSFTSNPKMYATRLARAAASRPAAGLSSASHVGSTSRAVSEHA